MGLDRAANLAAAEEVLRCAARDGALLAVLPEYCSQYDPRGVGIEHAEPLDGPWVSGLREAAARHAVAVVAGVTVPDEPAQDAVVGERRLARNVVVAIGPDGALLGTYTKVHLYDAFGMRESDSIRAGDPAAEPLVVGIGPLEIGVVTCYDLRFPESVRRVALAGADLVVVPAAWVAGPGKAEQWRALLVARAIESTAFVVGVGQAGEACTGRSILVEPDGAVRAELADRAATATVELDPARIAEVRARNPVLELRRYDVVPREA